MTAQNNTAPLAPSTIVLHWLVAGCFILVLTVGLLLETFEDPDFFALHKSLGLLILAPILVRILWRLLNGFPEYYNSRKLERILARISHYGLLILTLVMPVAGIMMSIGGGSGLYFFGVELVAASPDPANPGKFIAMNALVGAIGHETHEIGGNLSLVLLGLHVAGALKHHFMEKDNVLKRMTGRA